jgi:NAD(P)-dependent dehydrogenase (short-subunit alcohol dehydrogenase family)
MLTALALVPTGAHLAALPNKMAMVQAAYFVAQQIYAGWALFGIVLFGALAANLAHTIVLRWLGRSFGYALAAFLLIAVSLVIFFVWAVEAMVAQVVQEWGRVDVLVANAGGGRGRPVDTKASTLDPMLLQLVTEMNLFGTVYSCNAVAPIMKQQRSGKIITVSSVAGTGPSIDGGYAHYGAAKAAIAHYTRYLAQDLGPFGITANCIAPGVIATGRIMRRSSPVAAKTTAIGPNWSPFGGSGRSRIAPRWSNSSRLTCPTM